MINLENEVQREAECRRAFEQEAGEARSRHDPPSTALVDKARNWWRSVQDLLAAYGQNRCKGRHLLSPASRNCDSSLQHCRILGSGQDSKPSFGRSIARSNEIRYRRTSRYWFRNRVPKGMPG